MHYLFRDRQQEDACTTVTIRTVTSVVESIVASSNDDVTIAHLSYVIHAFHITSRYNALLLKLTVKDQDTSVITATPELLVHDTQTSRP